MSLTCLLTTTILPPRLSQNWANINRVCIMRLDQTHSSFNFKFRPPLGTGATQPFSMNVIMRSRPLGVLVQHDSSPLECDNGERLNRFLPPTTLLDYVSGSPTHHKRAYRERPLLEARAVDRGVCVSEFLSTLLV